MANYIYSTSSSDQRITLYKNKVQPGEKMARAAVVTQSVFIKGKANIMDPKTMITPRGVVTEVSDLELELLEGNKTFQKMVKDGFMYIERGAKQEKPVEKVVENMQKKDKSAQPTKKSLEKERAEKLAEANKATGSDFE